MAVRNLNNEPLGRSTEKYSFRTDKKTKEILDFYYKCNMNISQVIRDSILLYYETKTLKAFYQSNFDFLNFN